MLKNVFTTAIALFVLAGVACATVTDVHWESVDGDPTVAGTVQNTLVTSMTADWTNCQMTITLSQGSLVNPSTGVGQEFRFGSPAEDSWLDAPNAPSSFITVIGADYAVGQFDWMDTASNAGVIDGIAARIYATDDAMGSWSLDMFDADGAYSLSGDVVNGAFAAVPEPTGIVMLILGAVAVMFRRK